MPGRIVDQSHFFPKGLLGREKDFGWCSSVGIGRYTGEVLHGELLAIPLDCKLQANWRASEASETPSIATSEKNVRTVRQNHNAHAHFLVGYFYFDRK